MSERGKEYLSIFASWGGIAVLVFAFIGYSKFRVTCTDTVIPFGTTTTQDANAVVGTNTTQSEGIDGKKTVCKRGNGKVLSETTTPAVNKVVVEGTRPPSGPYTGSAFASDSDDSTSGIYEADACPITTCNDGSCSSSTGRGTCSHHSGVAHY